MRFLATQKQIQIFRLAAVAYEKLGDVTSKNLEHLGCSPMQLDGRRAHVLFIAETLEKDGRVDMNAEHRIAARAALELHKKEALAAEKKLEQLELVTDVADLRIDAIEELLHDIDEQMELQPETEDESEENLPSLDEHIADVEADLARAKAEPLEETPRRKPGDEWIEDGRSFIVARDGKIFDITDQPEKVRKNIRRAARRKSRSGEVNTRKQTNRKR